MMHRLPITTPRVALSGALVLALGLAGCSAAPSHRSAPRPTSASPSATPPSTTATGGPTSTDAQSSPLGVHWDMSRLDNFDPYLESIRGSATFHEVVWCKVEKTQGHPDWRQVDQIAEAAQRHGIALYLKIRVGACWATGGPPKMVRGSANKTESAMPKDLNAYAGFVHALAQRYETKGVHTYAVENEVNSASFWDGTPQDYIKLTEVAAKELRATDPQAQVVDAGMSSTSYGYGLSDRLLGQGKSAEAISAFNTYFERRIGTRGEAIPKVTSVEQLRAVLSSDQGKRNLEYLAAAKTLAERKVTDIRQVHFYEPWQATSLLSDYLKAQTPAGTPIEAWEVGSFWKSAGATDLTRADEMVRTVSLLLAGGMQRVLWLPLATSSNNRRGEEIRYGLLDPDGTMRPAGQVMAEMVAASRGARVSAVRTGNLQGVSFERDGADTLVVWSTHGDVQLTVGAKAQQAQLGATLRPVINPVVTIGAVPTLVQTTVPLQQALAAGG